MSEDKQPSETGEKLGGYSWTYPEGSPSNAHVQPAVGFQQPVPPSGLAPPAGPPYYPPSGQVVLEMSGEKKPSETSEKAGYPGTFPGGVPSYAYAQPSVGFQHPIPPPGSAPPTGPPYYTPSGQAVPGFAVAQVTLTTEDPLPCCGLGLGWFLFILGFFLGVIPWYIGAVLLCCVKGRDTREKPGYIACTVAAAVVLIIVIISVAINSTTN